jgi:hypothetical protein
MDEGVIAPVGPADESGGNYVRLHPDDLRAVAEMTVHAVAQMMEDQEHAEGEAELQGAQDEEMAEHETAEQEGQDEEELEQMESSMPSGTNTHIPGMEHEHYDPGPDMEAYERYCEHMGWEHHPGHEEERERMERGHEHEEPIEVETDSEHYGHHDGHHGHHERHEPGRGHQGGSIPGHKPGRMGNHEGKYSRGYRQSPPTRHPAGSVRNGSPVQGGKPTSRQARSSYERQLETRIIRMEREALATRLDADLAFLESDGGVIMDREQELIDLLAMSPQGRERHMERIRSRYQRVERLDRQSEIPIGYMEDEQGEPFDPDADESGMTKREAVELARYAREKGIKHEEAVSTFLHDKLDRFRQGQGPAGAGQSGGPMQDNRVVRNGRGLAPGSSISRTG